MRASLAWRDLYQGLVSLDSGLRPNDGVGALRRGRSPTCPAPGKPNCPRKPNGLLWKPGFRFRKSVYARQGGLETRPYVFGSLLARITGFRPSPKRRGVYVEVLNLPPTPSPRRIPPILPGQRPLPGKAALPLESGNTPEAPAGVEAGASRLPAPTFAPHRLRLQPPPPIRLWRSSALSVSAAASACSPRLGFSPSQPYRGFQGIAIMNEKARENYLDTPTPTVIQQEYNSSRK